MSVSTLDRPVPASTPGLPTARAARPASAPAHHNAGHVSFSARQHPTGPMFNAGQHAEYRHNGQGQTPHAALLETPANTLMALLRKMFGNGFGDHRPAHAAPCQGKPRPHETHRPDPAHAKPNRPGSPYAKQSNEQLAQRLLDNFDAFKDPKSPDYITTQALEAMASRALTGNPSVDQNIRLARELLKRPELVQALDRNSGTGATDGLISRETLTRTLKSQSPFKYQDDKQLAGEMLKHFDELKGGFWSRTINIDDLKDLASRKLTGDPAKDHLIWLAREITQRSDALMKMDNTGSRDDDGLISKKALRKLSR